ncbi:tRNA (adenosine(37)-N6)-threonylcarbamoyltransferase complex ATPase subunit type 1 TsaE [Candidatus Kaiserbacteria bacterium RIFCSPLOWO2_01_FULL_53_17]|uniref:tRNA threonylcarbamoyladenosine biosynthesis protein TsaE n=1 Tax=Candidatus Kaiserbacteria bacterium RIFCSPLOWO2_01_FULL_53_17 TaxID=1798511 RepID=A0A1F6EGT4_9BACT|nr:MAG: tRNA (adenosine(37)-N6)-threonylcarbamoyltransferase complex ATPase subunit type 1 TsaE [Candidatus Kaiserbacteria bacterium RIFCSPLOWO2_01_FULL_53_17]
MAELAKELLGRLSKKPQATVLALYGDLGSGKTTFVQELGKLIGVDGSVQSPTFVIMKRYTPQDARYKFFIHIDAYRLEKPEELTRLGWEEVVNNPENLIAVEWAERVETILPKDCVRIHFKFIDETTREIQVLQ